MTKIITTKNALVMFIEDRVQQEECADLRKHLEEATGQKWVIVAGMGDVEFFDLYTEKYAPVAPK